MCDSTNSVSEGRKRADYDQKDNDEPYPRSYTPDLPPNFETNLPEHCKSQSNNREPVLSKPENQPKDHQVLDDPFSMDFEKIVDNLDHDVVYALLSKILQFLKSKQTELALPTTSDYKEAFLSKLAGDQSNFRCKIFDSSSRRLCLDIQDVLDSKSKAFKLNYTYDHRSGSRRVLVYQKIYYDNFKTPHSSSSLERSYRDSDRDRDLTGAQRDLLDLINDLADDGDNFVNNALDTIKDFVHDSSRSSLDLPSCSKREASFIKSLNKFLHKESLTWMLGDKGTDLANDITSIMRNSDFTLNICEGRMAKRSGSQDFIIKKCYRNKDDKRDRTDSKNSKYTDESVSNAVYDPRQMFLAALSTRRTDEDKQTSQKQDIARSQTSTNSNKAVNETTKESNSTVKQDGTRSQTNTNSNKSCNDTSKDSNTSVKQDSARSQASTNSNKSLNSGTRDSKFRNIQWAKEGETPEMIERERTRPERVRKTKLMEALSTPVVCDTASRMMRRMGWAGGALGARGEGITEPIMPAINIKAGAGLGHVADPSRKDRKSRRRNDPTTEKTQEFRKDILEFVLDFLRAQESSEKVIELSHPLSRRETKFLSTALAGFNARKNIGLNLDCEKELVCRILANMNCKPNVMLDRTISDDLRTVTLTKRTTSHSRRKRRRHHTEAEIDDNPSSEDTCQSVIHTVKAAEIDDMIDELSDNREASRKSVVSIAYRVIFFEKLLQFVESKLLGGVIVFEEPLNGKQSKMIENTVYNLNKNLRADYSSARENNLYRVLRKEVDCQLKIKFSSAYRRVELEKLYSKRRLERKLRSRRDSESERDGNNRSALDEVNSDKSVKIDRRNDSADLDRNDTDHINDSDSDCTSVASLQDYDVIDIEFDDASSDGKRDDDKQLDDSDDSDKVVDDSDVKVICKDERLNNNHYSRSDGVQVNGESSRVSKVKNRSNSILDDVVQSNSSPGSSKRSRTNSENSDRLVSKRPKKTDKRELVTISIDNIDMVKDIAKTVQQFLYANINSLKDLPKLKCLGIIDNSLQYICANAHSVTWLTRQINELCSEDLKLKIQVQDHVTEEKSKTKMAAKINTFLTLDAREFFEKIQMYNPLVNIKCWDVLSNTNYDDYVVIHLYVDDISLRVIREADYELYAGIDKVEFSHVWP